MELLSGTSERILNGIPTGIPNGTSAEFPVELRVEFMLELLRAFPPTKYIGRSHAGILSQISIGILCGASRKTPGGIPLRIFGGTLRVINGGTS